MGSVSSDHPGIIELYGALACGEIAAFYRLADEARLAPHLHGRIAMARMAGSEMRHYELLHTAIRDLGREPIEVMKPYVEVLDAYHQSTLPSTWPEALVKAYIGDAIAADFYLEIASAFPDDVANVVRGVLAETHHSEFVKDEVRSIVERDKKEADRLRLWARRLFGEALTQAQHVLGQRDELTELLLTASGDLNHIATLFESMQGKNDDRMKTLGLE
ncbi:ferritin-like domain-containing protein [Hoyosella sp. YIM 151337]|uniref:ferritin-like domain-containing protein n=1 Tax=Hoyosella sp. YIM 151337 TaxID=2992742 RepID=UPI0022365516|nr:ferritin-like domain-containing protein [Hoyosella sp. YIM 151337]MCW4352279.1 ferritin-like domain-containing protein [Hoyosella sp. YIM 151337]